MKMTLKYTKYLSLVTLTLQNAALCLTMRAARTQEKQFSAPVAIMLAELIKLITCTGLVCLEESGPIGALMSFKTNILMNCRDTMKVAVLSIVYYVQNNLIYVGSTHLDAVTCQVTFQLKILTTAVFSVLILNQKLTKIQWASLIALFFGVGLIEMTTVASKKNVVDNSNLLKREEKPLVGFVAILTACCLSGLSGVCFEKILKNNTHNDDDDVSLWIRNIQLSLLAMPIGFVQVFVLEYEIISRNGIFYGFTGLTWSCVMLQALGGLLVAMAIKFANNIQKGFALSLAIVVSTLGSVVFFNFKLTPIFLAGASLVVGSVLTYNWPSDESKSILLATQRSEKDTVSLTRITSTK